ncbi:MAG TPA: lysylphosphatidylglycerol synthase transmembrane domain-containing protein [Candidatus Acidoferrales bacterium]|nr:lysylphosphatidylglycerol synthase transmembrane domain-containing protein [Candidatus Acidoferrales bacterium]
MGGLVWGLVRFAIGIGLLVYLAKSGIIDFGTLRKLFSSWPVSLAAVALMGVDVVMMSLRLTWLLRPHGLRLPLGKSLQLTFVSFFFTTFLPGSSGGILAKLFYAARDNEGRRTEIAAVVIFDRAVGLLSLLLLSLAVVPAFPHLVWSVVDLRLLVLIDLALTVGLLAGFLVVLLDGSWANRLLRKVLGWMPWKDLPRRVFDAISFYRRSTGTLLAALGASLLANFSVVCVAALARFALQPSSFALRVLLVAPMGYIANSLPLTPGGLGVGEEAFNSLFKLMGLGGGADVLVGWRIWSLPVSIVGLVCYLRGLGRSVHHEEEAAAQDSER